MELRKKIKVLIVDDSALFREVLTKAISSDASMQVVATAGDPYDARDKIIKYEPDVMTCDVEMPRMSGIEFIRRLMPQYPLPTIVVSTVSGAVFDAMNAGAVDFISKPDLRSVNSVEVFVNELILKIKIAASSRIQNTHMESSDKKGFGPIHTNHNQIIAIGASTGGTEAIYRILKELPSNLPGIVIVQHIPPDFSRMFAERLNNTTGLNVKEAQTGDVPEVGKVLIAPGSQHMKVIKRDGKYVVECFEGEKVNGHCPSVDVLFDSVAKEAGSHAIGIILTGMGYDGAKGLLAMRRKGARTIGQDEASSVVYGMPKVAFNIGAVEKQASLSNIPRVLCAMLN